MSVFNEILSSRFNNVLRSFLPVDEQEGAPTLSSDVQPSFELVNVQQDLQYLLKTRLCGTSITVPAGGVGNLGFLALVNNSSNVLATVILYRASLRTSVGVMRNTAQLLANVGTAGVIRDTRWALGTGMITATLPWSRAANAATIGHSLLEDLPIDAQGSIPIVLTPGYSFVIEAQATNQAFNANIQWLERQAQAAELVQVI